MIGRLLMLLGVVILAGCDGSPPPPKAEYGPAAGTTFSAANVQGEHWISQANYASRRFAPYRHDAVVLRLDDTAEGQRVRGTFPLVGSVDCIVVRTMDLWGPRYEWSGRFEANGEPWKVRITVDLYGGATIGVTDCAYDGVAPVDDVSSTILYRPGIAPVGAG